MLFERCKNNPIISPDTRKPYESACAYNPAAVLYDNKVYVVYRAEGKTKVSSLCLAVSEDGYNFNKYENNPIIKPTLPEEKQGCEGC